jgi:hypothetical protein
MSKLLISLALLLALSTGCQIFRSSESVESSEEGLKRRTARYIQRQLAENQFDAEWVVTRAKISYSDSNESIRFQANIRIRKDSAIWMNFRKLSIEVARLLITTDSVFLIDRINNQYLATDLGYIQRNFHLPANFQAVQSLLFGNPFYLTQQLDVTEEGGEYVMEGKQARLTQQYFVNPETFLLTGLAFIEPENGRNFQMRLGDHQMAGKKNFSYFRQLKINDPLSGPVFIDLELSKLEIDIPKTMPFEIPAHYSRIQ